ncbi:MAG: cysteine--tRNA ligase [Deltaproteobacteria bacterium RIFCSPLOWO2_12_FULL_44_12]|nr:MAG: cysteine--tRNA ligase [Deltaproteobacteria bacterium RIFCSPHIGHO2_01_FULL_43_49]OGQ14727.1 MAG: cysteine--tRNA ligase [Deltaproteobacteria bacterium RIFCSPHIGHO2_02_FULL_44_53]OGQ28113.1 MAG: cysteine--tRNA ligase [Deltaproteobacteria bacterium RIFCSPHIGHO2_12_FULL_44_21]OGQ31325.1 MAG: cysteine--tRNA ligase [Deltaproteobacteria bacterium RIFCSPLOWO2_01_FULL_45_74]OGQ43317.1 MAG: cysteine--tRNA ligase [Deltaproteobacteria bacterium RIFCSPLOWO2_02_FULL_44_34]OGQ70790.1 MAG: cysteine--tR
MPIRVYNSLTQKKELFKPIKKGKVGMYVCGITAYDSCHLGHARAAVAFDVIYRYLKYRGLDVTYVRNYTDIDDKIINRAKETNTPWNELTESYIREYQEDMEALNVLKPTKEPRATEHIKQMIQSIEALIKNKVAYESKGSVYYAVRQFKNYGKLSHKNIEELESGARIEIDETKKDPLDFALWKAAKPSEPSWDSPWGKGRPGWHIECSTMSTHYLKQPFDIHGGGRDLIFPHHENELAQAEGAAKKHFCNYFLHNGFININAEKMSKSLRNFKTIREVVAEHHPEVVRYFLIAAHYGSPIDYTQKNMADARAAVDRFYLLAGRLQSISDGKAVKVASPKDDLEKELAKSLKELPQKFEAAMDENFNTAQALGSIFETIRIFNKYLDGKPDLNSPFAKWAKGQWNKLQKDFCEVLGVFGLEASFYFKQIKQVKVSSQGLEQDWIEKKIEERRQARLSKDFKRGDTIRDELSKMGVELKDRPDGTTEWHLR